MSTLKTNYLQHPSSSTANLTLESDGSVSGGLPTAGRNLLYNGAMQVAQRGTSTAGISSGISYYTADRWLALDITLGTWTQSVENDAPAGTGFRKSLKMLCTAADATPAASDALYVGQSLEGQDLQRIAKGTSSAKELTLSFWVKANVTGTYAVGLYDIDNSRFVSKNYTISASATWEKKTVTFPADTTGAFDNDNAGSLRVNFWLASGSDYSGGSLPTTWGSSSGGVANGQVNLASATNNYWQITGVQLEVGPVATPFEFEDFGTTLRKCQRYFEKTYNADVYPGGTTTNGYISFYGASDSGSNIVYQARFMVTKRAAPTVKAYNQGGAANSWTYARSGSVADVTATVDLIGNNGCRIYGSVGAASVACQWVGHYTADAEL